MRKMNLTRIKGRIATALRPTALRMLLACVSAASLTSCDSVIYDEQGDCDIHYRMAFRFDYNVLFADAFPQQVKSVTLYAFNQDGTFEWQRSESGPQLAIPGYTMNLDGVPPGVYDIVAWCGLDNSWRGPEEESFELPEMSRDTSTIDDLRCRLVRSRGAGGGAESVRDLWPLYHGILRGVEILPPDAPGAYGQTVTYRTDLVKDTNRVRVILQQLSGENIDAEKFDFKIESDNGHMAYDNTLLKDKKITYRAWKKESGVAGIAPTADGEVSPASEEYTPVHVAIADMTVARLTTDNPVTLTVTNPEGETTARIPLVDYALLVKGHYQQYMTDQEFLDREDTYTLTFFLDKNSNWLSASIVINSWRVVLDKVEISSIAQAVD